MWEGTKTHMNTMLERLYTRMSTVLVWSDELITAMIVTFFAWWHILVEWPPWSAKTLAATTFAWCIKGYYNRIQFTPDLLPSDITGGRLFNQKTWSFETYQGPIMTNILLADEINRAPATVQSALLQAMAEWTVMVGLEQFVLPSPFFVIATQNPYLYEGTYPLSEAQTDRFLCAVQVWYWSVATEIEILNRHWSITKSQQDKSDDQWAFIAESDCIEAQSMIDEVYAHPSLVEYIARCIDASRNLNEYSLWDRSQYLQAWLSSRAGIGLMRCAKVYARREWRSYILPEDVKQCMMWVCSHRVRLSYAAAWTQYTAQAFIQDLIDAVPLVVTWKVWWFEPHA